jgi:predicted nucleotidyltransferase
MISKETIEEVKNRLVATYNPVTIYLFGSYAWGNPSQDSDLDLLIIVDQSTEKSYKRPIAGYKALHGLGISKDIIIHTQDEFNQTVNNITTLMHKIKKDGKVLYVRA